MTLAAELVAAGGPSAPVWAFLTAISVGILALIGQQLSAKRAANEAKVKAAEAATSAKKAEANTANISNGFASDVDRDLKAILKIQTDLERSFRGHLEWHDKKEVQ